MYEELSLVRMASSMARHAGARHRVIAENVSNADTPDYRARDVKGFAEYVKESFTASATRPGHKTGSSFHAHALDPQVYFDNSATPSANGNSVSLENEMVKSVAAQGQHTLATVIYRKTHDLMRITLGR